MDARPVGIFDSGLGGLTAVRELKKLLPHENIVYFGDNARVPYGGRSRETIQRYAEQDIRFLLSHEVKVVVAACGTVSTNPPPRAFFDTLPVEYTNVLIPAARSACEKTKNGKIGVIATAASIHSGAYERAIAAQNPELLVLGKACPLFVPLIENGYIARNNPVTLQVARDYLEPMLREGIDTLILGCTHYPIIKGLIADIVGPSVTLVDSGKECARFVKGYLTENGLLNTSDKPGEQQYYVSDKEQDFGGKAGIFLGEDISSHVKQVAIDRY